MSAESTTYAALSAWSPLTALVASRIYPDEAAEGAALPAVIYERSGSSPHYTLSGELVACEATISVSVVARTRAAANQVADAITAAMHAISAPSIERDGESYPEEGLYQTTVSFSVWE